MIINDANIGNNFYNPDIWRDFVPIFGRVSFLHLAGFCSDVWREVMPTFGCSPCWSAGFSDNVVPPARRGRAKQPGAMGFG